MRGRPGKRKEFIAHFSLHFVCNFFRNFSFRSVSSRRENCQFYGELKAGITKARNPYHEVTVTRQSTRVERLEIYIE